MRVYVGGVATLVPARWFWCLPGALQFPTPHGCAASPWLDNLEVNRDWGEVTPYPRDRDSSFFKGLDRGLNPGYPGRTYIGEPQWFIDGQLPAAILDDPIPTLCPRCLQPALVAPASILLGGSAVATGPPPISPCLACREGFAPVVLRVIATGATGDFAGMNGTWLLPAASSPCSWFLEQAAQVFNVQGRPGTFWTIGVINTLTGAIAEYSLPSPIACLQPQAGWIGGPVQGVGMIPALITGP